MRRKNTLRVRVGHFSAALNKASQPQRGSSWRVLSRAAPETPSDAALPQTFSHKTLWTMRQAPHQITADIAWTAGQWELRLFSDSELITSRRFAHRSAAVAYADLFQQDLERDGWQ